MNRIIVVILLTLTLPFSAMAQGMRAFNEVSIVALIITSGEETDVSISVTNTLESLDAQTLTANAPNASEMRSILKRFTAAAIDIDIALVYYDGAVLEIGERAFVAPGGIELDRASDLLTKAIPLSALARATALAGSGGAVLVHSSGQDVSLIDGVTLVDTAPEPRTGTSPILFASNDAAERLAAGLEAMSEAEEDIDLTEVLAGLASLEGVSVSQLPVRPALFRHVTPPAPVVTAIEATATNPIDETEGTTTALPQVEATDETPATEEATASPEPAAEEEVLAADEPETAEPVAEVMAEATDDTATVEAEMAEATAAAAQDSELSIDVLRAMQGALTRTHKRELQRNLRNMGFYRGLIDGIFGRQSAKAISAYQESIGASVSGVLTPAQLEALSQ